MNTQCKIILENKEEHSVPLGTSLRSIEQTFYSDAEEKIMAFKVNLDLKELNYCLSENVNRLEPIFISHKDGVRIYQRSLVFVFARAVRELFPNARTRIEHSLSKGLFCEVEKSSPLNESEVVQIEDRMRSIIDLDEAFELGVLSNKEAKKAYLDLGMPDKAKLLDYRIDETVKVYTFGGMMDYYYGYMLPSSGKLDVFALKYYDGGIIIRHPSPYSEGKLPAFEEHKKLARVHREAEAWGRILGVEYLRNINDHIVNGEICEKILTTEALHAKKIIEIAEEICAKKTRVILIAGPSSSGKTTFANRLKIQLGVNGLRPVTISVDDYFVNRDLTPKDKNGDYDFESIDAIDRKKFNADILELMAGRKALLPSFDFKEGKRRRGGVELQVTGEQPLIIEGIHCLNPKLTELIPEDYKYRIYISCLTQLNIDEHNRIPTTDSRLIRRLVRDNTHRGNDGISTLRLWQSVRRGEEKNIFPYQETADAIFNSATSYELSALKKYVEPILKEVPTNLPEISEANRLLKLLRYVLPLDEDSCIPNTAIIREFIGGSVFET